jgi:hypothetical protein
MLKRCQILLEDWQEEYLKDIADRYDQSFSEITRVMLSESFLHVISLLQPEYKAGISDQEFKQMIKKSVDPRTALGEQHRLLSRLYFEARKAVEYRLGKVKKQGNRRKDPKK